MPEQQNYLEMDSGSSRKRRRVSPSRNEYLASPADSSEVAANKPDFHKHANTVGHQSYDHTSATGDSRNHYGNQYNNYLGTVYQRSSHEPQHVVTPSSIHQQRKEYEDLLHFEGVKARLNSVKTNHHKTCKWFLQRSEYLDWRDMNKFSAHHGFLWVTGKPGTGKSTIIRFAYNTALEDTKNLRNGMAVAYFFSREVTVFENSLEAMLRSLLHQVLELWPDADLLFESLQARTPGFQTLNQARLMDAFKFVVKSLGDQHLTCFIDALDECNSDDVQTVLSFLGELGELAESEGLQFFICYSSRHYRALKVPKREKIVLEDQDGHAMDIRTYIESTLRLEDVDPKPAMEIREEVERKADGIFLWVYLVVPLLNDTAPSGQIRALRRCLEALPQKLTELFHVIIYKGLDSDYQRLELSLTRQWILYAERSLSWRELYFAVLSEIDLQAVWDFVPDSVTDESMQRFVVHSSRGLAETTKGQPPRVQFIHDTVRSYLLQSNALPELLGALDSQNVKGCSHDRLKQCCDSYISVTLAGSPDLRKSWQVMPAQKTKKAKKEAQEIRESQSAKHPFLQYAVRGIFYHADSASDAGSMQEPFVNDFALLDWIALDNLFEQYDSHRHSLTATKAYIFAEKSFTNLLNTEIKLNAQFNAETGERFRTPLGAAVYNGNERDVRLLLDNKVDPMYEKRGESWTTAFDVAARRGHTKILKMLLYRSATSYLQVKNNCNLLYVAATEGHYETVQLLLEEGADANAVAPRKAGRYGTPLQGASAKGHTNVVKLLLECSAVDKRHEGYYETSLHGALCKGHKDIVELFLGPGVNVNDKTMDTPFLHVACITGQYAFVELLLEKGADPNATDRYTGTALHVASSKGYTKIVNLLISKGADKNANNKNVTNQQLGTALYAASFNGHKDVVELLLESGVEVNAVGGRFDTALRAASYRGHENVVRTLLDSGARIDYSPDRTPYGPPHTLRGIMGTGRWIGEYLDSVYDSYASNNYGTALQLASSVGHEKVVRLLLSRNADRNAWIGTQSVALQTALANGRGNVVDIIMHHGAEEKAGKVRKITERKCFVWTTNQVRSSAMAYVVLGISDRRSALKS